MIGIIVLILVIIGTPVFAIMAGWTELAWMNHENPAMHVMRFLAPDVLDERFAGSPILVTVPLFTFVGYMMAQTNTPHRIVRAAHAVFGWLPGGLAIVCIMASAFFTTFTGGSAVTIVAIGALLYPTMVKDGYPEWFALGLVTTSGSVGLLLPPSLPILIYALVAGIDFNKAFKSGIVPGFFIIAMLSLFAGYVAIKHRVPRHRFVVREAGAALWDLKWEFGVPLLVLVGLATGLTSIDESAALAAFYAAVIEIYIYKDITYKQFLKVARDSVGLAGGLLLIMAMAMSLTNYMVSEQIPDKIYTWMTGLGITEKWQFLVALNMFLYFMVLDGISMVLVSVPLITPFAAKFFFQPFHMCIIFLLNLEVCSLAPPFGQNVFVASYRFNKSMMYLYKITAPFLVIMTLGLIIVDAVPTISTFAVAGDIAEAKATAAKFHEPPREAWLMECVQEDRNNPLPCTPEERKQWASLVEAAAHGSGSETAAEPGAEPGKGAEEGADQSSDEMLNDLLGEDKADGGADDSEEDLLKALTDDEADAAVAPAPAPAAAPSAAP